MGMAKKVGVAESQVPAIEVSAVTAVSAIPVTKVEAERVTKQDKKVTEKTEKKAVAYGRELSDYELQKDRKIGIAGVVQAVIGSEWYAAQAALTDLSNKDSVTALRQFAKEEAEFWLDVIKAKSE